MDNTGTVAGRNPVIEAIRSGRAIDKIFILKGEREGSIIKIAAMARDAGIVVQDADRQKLDAAAGGVTHQGVVALCAVHEYSTVDDIFAKCVDGEPPFIIICDGITDPHNLGAIIRTADAAGAHGIIVPKHDSVGLTATVAKTSAGALEYVCVAKVGNIATTIDQLKKRGVWVCAADMAGEPLHKADMSGAIAIVIGAEGKGVSRLVKERCDFSVSIPMRGKVGSLNASVAAGVLMFDVARRRLLAN